MRKTYQTLWMCLMAIAFIACKDKDNLPLSFPVQFQVSSVDNLKNVTYTTATVTYQNLSNGVEKSEPVTISNLMFKLNLVPGLYNVSFEAKGTYLLGRETKQATFKAKIENLVVKEEDSEVTVHPFLYIENAGFVIEEIFYTGTVPPGATKHYIGDQYIKITNNSDQPLDAGGLVLVETEPSSWNKHTYTPNIMNEAMVVHALYRIPDKGAQKHMVQPGQSIIIADKAINHKIDGGNANSFDLSKANFEWYDESTNEKLKVKDTDNPLVPNLEKIYCYTKNIWVLHFGGSKAYALVDLKEEPSTFLQTHKHAYSYKVTIPKTGEEKTMYKNEYKIPNEWVIDAVQISTPDKWAWNVVAPSLDASYTYCGETSVDPKRYGKAMRRKVLSTTPDGRRILQDTNDSTNDFDRDITPSLAN